MMGVVPREGRAGGGGRRGGQGGWRTPTEVARVTGDIGGLPADRGTQ